MSLSSFKLGLSFDLTLSYSRQVLLIVFKFELVKKIAVDNLTLLNDPKSYLLYDMTNSLALKLSLSLGN